VWEVPRLSMRVEGQRHWRRNWVHAADEHPGVSEGDMPTKNDQRKLGTTRGSPRLQTGYSEGSAYKPPCGEVALCRQVGRMGPTKR
jgi:hypothetical protein